MVATAKLSQMLRPGIAVRLLAFVLPASDPVDVLLLVPLPAVIDPPVVAASLVTTPEVVKAISVRVSVDPRLCSHAALFMPATVIDVKQNSSEFSGVVAHPLGQHTLLVPLTEYVM